MEEEEIIAAGIKQAVKKGESLDKAMQTFLNAGYSREIVERAARKASGEKFVSVPLSEPVSVPATAIPIKSTHPVPVNALIRARPRQPMPMPRMPIMPRREFKPLAKPTYGFPEEKPKRTTMTWIIAILIIIFVLLVNGFLVWKYVLQ